ncbi:protein FAM19A5 [Arapaima gigas]
MSLLAFDCVLPGQLVAGTCEIVTLDRDSSQPRRTIARQTARCACKKGQIAGTTRARPACVEARIVRTKQWCEMLPCLEDEGCDLLVNRSGWTCTQAGGRVKTTTVSHGGDRHRMGHAMSCWGSSGNLLAGLTLPCNTFVEDHLLQSILTISIIISACLFKKCSIS